MGRYFLKQRDSQRVQWQEQFLAQAAALALELGLTPADLAAAQAAAATFQAAHEQALAQSTAALAAAAARRTARQAVTTTLAGLIRRIQAHPATTDAQRAALGLPIRDAIPTPASPPSTRPEVSIDAGDRLCHRIDFRATGGQRKKPKGVLGCQIYRAVGTPPQEAGGPDALEFVMLATRTPALITYPGMEGGKMAYYWLRWVSTRGEVGPWSEQVGATVQG